MVERKSHEAFYRKPLRIGSAALTLALVTSMAPSFTASGLDRAMAAQPAQTAPSFAPMANEPAQDQIIDADMIASGRVKKAANLTDAHGVGKGLISGHVYLTTPGGNPGASYDNGNVKMDGITVMRSSAIRTAPTRRSLARRPTPSPMLSAVTAARAPSLSVRAIRASPGPISSAKSIPGRHVLTRSTASGLSLSPTNAATVSRCSARPTVSCPVLSMVWWKPRLAPSV